MHTYKHTRVYICIYIYLYNIYASFEMCFDHIHINNFHLNTKRYVFYS